MLRKSFTKIPRAKIWSKLSNELRTSPSLKAFKAQIRKVDLSSHVDNNRSCCKLCYLEKLHTCIFTHRRNVLFQLVHFYIHTL